MKAERKKKERQLERNRSNEVQRGGGKLIYKEKNKVERKENFEKIKFIIKLPFLSCLPLQIPV
jgi:hypothetical protein